MDSLRPGDPRQIGDYLLSGRLGSGGMGEVFFGRSRGGRAVAVKLIRPLFADDAEFRRRFRGEIEACRTVGGFHTAPVLDADPSADRPWMATAYVPGPPLNKVLDAYPKLPLHSVRVLGAGLAEALQAIHAARIIHRDLKPSNILLADDGPLVIDFGIARAADASGITAQHGTPGFMAPEVLKKESVSPACDVFALGVVLAFAGGVRPYGVGTADTITNRVMYEEPDLDGLDPLIRDLVAKCLAGNPGDRPTPEELLERLGEYDPLSRWLPPPIHEMIIASLPRETATVDDSPPDHARLLAEAEQIARALPDEDEQATALLHIATVAHRMDPPHAARLINDAWRGRFVSYLIESSPAEVGMAAGHSAQALADRMLSDIAEYSRVQTHRHMGAEEETARVITAIAEAAAVGSPARGEQLARVLIDESLQAVAVARVAIAVAHADPGRAEQLTRGITGRIDQATRPGADPAGAGRLPRWGRKRARTGELVLSPGARLPDEVARYWAARALAAVALGVAGIHPGRPGRAPADAEQFARTITVDGPAGRAPLARGTTAAADRAYAGQCLADAGQLALSIAASGYTATGIAAADLRAGAVAAVKTAAAQLDPGHADAFLREAEEAARAIGDDAGRFESLGQVALIAAYLAPEQAEQIARSLLSRPPQLGELALAVSLRDPVRARRVADAIRDEYVRALVRAALLVRTAPDDAGPRLSEAERAAGESPAQLIAVAMLTAGTDPVHAERLARAVKGGPESADVQPEAGQYERPTASSMRPAEYRMRSAGYWRARALAGLAIVSYEKSGHGIKDFQERAWN